jgi:hypothetical protein
VLIIIKPYIMKYFEIVYLPTNRSDKEWIHTEDSSKESAVKNFNGGTLISCKEIDEDDYEMPEHLR